MGATIDHQDVGAGSADELKGLDILLVEDSRDVGDAVKMLLELCGARVDGPAANTAEAEGLLAAHRPDVALVDFHLRGGEESSGFIRGCASRVSRSSCCPDRSDLARCRRLKARPSWRSRSPKRTCLLI